MSEPKPGWPLGERTGLPPGFAWLRDAFPRDRWTDVALPLLRHLDDEEDIVIPLIARHADAFQA